MNFLNVKTGEIYNGDLHNSNEGVFTHYFEGQQSINGVYTQLFVIIDDSSDDYTISLEDNPVFFLLELPVHNTDNSINIDDREFYKLDEIKTPSVTTNTVQLPVDNRYIHSFWVGCTSAAEGEFRQELEIKQDDVTLGFISIGADFYGEDEPLTKNMENFGVEIPSIFQKALFPVNVHEDLNDNIVLNRKRRELLTEYWNLIANKGSYDSLINSLKFFEYGDLVRIEEYWQRLQSGRKIFLGDDLENALDDQILEKINILKRTTYCGLYLLLNPYTGGLDEETNPVTQQLDEISMRWIEEDLALKMTLLGNFFSTYFMPIHLDLLHSSIERRAFTLAHNIITGSTMERRDHYDCCLPVMLRAYNVDDIDNVNERTRFYLEDTNAYVYSNTIFGDPTLDLTDYRFIGAEPLRNTEENHTEDLDDNRDSSITAAHWYQGIAKIVKFNSYIPSRIVDPNDLIWKQTIVISKKAGSVYELDREITTYVSITPETDEDNETFYDFNFYLLFENATDYLINVEFETLNRRIYTAQYSLTVLNTGENYIKLYRVLRNNVDELMDYGDQDTDFWNQLYINNFSFCNTHQEEGDYQHRYILVNASGNNNYRYLGTNSVIMLILDSTINNTTLETEDGGSCPLSEISSDIAANALLNYLQTDTYFSHYWWDLRERCIVWTSDTYWDSENHQWVDPDTTNMAYVLIGVRKAFTIDPAEGDDFLLNNVTITNYSDSDVIRIRTYRDGDTIHTEIDSIIPLTYYVKVKIDDLEGSDTPSINYTITDSEYFNATRTSNVIYSIYKKVDDVYEFISSFNGELYFQPYSSRDDYGKKVHKITFDTSNLPRYVDEERFFPILHRIEKLEEPCEINRNETIALIPTFERSEDVDPNSTFNWTFKNLSTGEEESLPVNYASREPFVSLDNNTLKTLTPGYYSVKATVVQDEYENVETTMCSFKVSK